MSWIYGTRSKINFGEARGANGGMQVKQKFPWVSFKTERPFMAGALITLGLVIWMHRVAYRSCKSSNVSPIHK